MKKVAFLINSLTDGGAEKVVLTVLNNINLKHTSIELICIEKNNFYALHKKIKVTYLSDSEEKNGLLKLLKLPFLAFKLAEYVKHENIYLVQSHLFRSNYIAILASKLFNSRHINQLVNHTLISTFYSDDITGRINKYLIKILFPMAETIISVSEIVKQDSINIYGSSNKNIVIHNPFDIQKIESLSFDKVDDFIFDINKKYLISVGRLIKIKRQVDILQVLEQLDENIELIFLGNGEEKNNLIQLSTELKLENRVHFLGRVINPFKYIRKSDILIITSQSESFGNVVIESFICNTPVISTDCGGPSELVDEDCGILIPIDNNKKLSEAINKILSDKIFTKIITKNSKKRANEFSIEKIINEYKEILCVD